MKALQHFIFYSFNILIEYQITKALAWPLLPPTPPCLSPYLGLLCPGPRPERVHYRQTKFYCIIQCYFCCFKRMKIELNKAQFPKQNSGANPSKKFSCNWFFLLTQLPSLLLAGCAMTVQWPNLQSRLFYDSGSNFQQIN